MLEIIGTEIEDLKKKVSNIESTLKKIEVAIQNLPSKLGRFQQ